jgi:hypothetical protein
VYRRLAGYGLQDWFAWMSLIGLVVGRLATTKKAPGSLGT